MWQFLAALFGRRVRAGTPLIEGATNSPRLRLVQGDITRLPVDAIVNAANSHLGPGGGVNYAINAAAGPGLQAELDTLGGCPVGRACVTGGHAIPVKYIIHAVGPDYRESPEGAAELLQACYQAALEQAAELGMEAVALPCLFVGNFGYPRDEACDIAVSTVRAWLAAHELPRQVIFCCYQPADFALYQARLGG